MEQQPTHAKKHRPLGVVKNVGIILLAPVLALVLTVFVFQAYRVEGLSMANTLADKDYLIVWKGSRSWSRMVGSTYIPNRGDIIIVDAKDLSACSQPPKQIVKRVIGLPGERVVYDQGMFTVYNTDHPKGFNPDATLPYGKDKGTDAPLLTNTTGEHIDMHVAKGHVFVAGDHRANSCDSRFIGPIDAHDIVGKVALRLDMSRSKVF